ncbi:MAG: hypothetical protein M3063_05460 [Actinomycetota bacterium]|nr:hypothetical protein [Actinomycetota bacterium]
MILAERLIVLHRALADARLHHAVVVTDTDRARLEREGLARLWWDQTPVDVFLSTHDAIAEARTAPGGEQARSTAPVNLSGNDD